MAKDVYFNNVPPNRNAPPPKTVRRRPAERPDEPPPQQGWVEFPYQGWDAAPYYGEDDYPPQPEEQELTPPAKRGRRAEAEPPAGSSRRSRPPAAPAYRQSTPAKKQKKSPPPPAAEAPPRRKRSAPRPAAEEAPPKKKKKHGFRRFVAFVLLFCFILPSLIGYGVYKKIISAYEPVAMNKSGVVDQSSLMHSGSVYNVLLMGVDQADVDSATRSDSMILMSVDKRSRQIKLTTFMRDMYVTIPGYGETKLNHACMYEGPQLTIDTIELNFGVRIDAYAKIGYDIFIELVNGVGGITVPQLDETECRALAEEGVHKEPGINVYFTGEEAIKYVRIRHWQSDFARTERQRKVITLIIDQAKKTPPHKLIALAESIASKIECTIPKNDLWKLALSILPCLFNEIKQQQIPADGTWSDATRDSLMVLLVDFEQNKTIIKNFIYGG